MGFDDRHPAWLEAFLHPKQAQGIVVQFAESHPELEGPPGEWPFPPTPDERPEPARCVGVRLACSTLERARLQWETLLGGTPAPVDDGVVYRWPDSGLRIHVVEDAAQPEGPLALEFSAPRPLAFPEGPHPVLGLPLVQIDEPEA